MKKVFLTAVFALLSFNAVSQININTDDLIGYWKPDEESTQLFFWKDISGILQVQEISGTSGEPLDLITLNVNKDSIFIRTIFMQNKWITESTYLLVDKKTLKCIVTGDGNGALIYTKIK